MYLVSWGPLFYAASLTKSRKKFYEQKLFWLRSKANDIKSVNISTKLNKNENKEDILFKFSSLQKS